jgi:hypothetical protein
LRGHDPRLPVINNPLGSRQRDKTGRQNNLYQVTEAKIEEPEVRGIPIAVGFLVVTLSVSLGIGWFAYHRESMLWGIVAVLLIAFAFAGSFAIIDWLNPLPLRLF